MTAVASFFARRLAGLRAEAEAEAEATRAADVATSEAPPIDLDALPEEEVLRLLDLPDPDTLHAGDDFTAFMAKTVPAYLRKRALRTLWRSNPVLACVDGLNDYDDDYLAMARDQGPFETSYQVGKGLLKHIERIAAQSAPTEETADTVAPVAEPAQDDVQTPEVPQPVAYAEADTEADAQSHDIPPAPRRMRFAFDEGAT
ncbi:hypothetical protein AN189_03870 [Loktanella sp. 3ANDIMAR09]|uniref:DUF3306 domain-containing protein n=1 Tax=Loktanella sp. 3ANDIMAR09 TaxID=1225657 RepID=UPI00070163CB|nr:DUF3306 domain-containing protein [Loktanella sp. 3ANDIMAR09]KQI69548.1 hypothetical protein AN189_03870 [Loktanella sp. 3ANDIMAR09]